MRGRLPQKCGCRRPVAAIQAFLFSVGRLAEFARCLCMGNFPIETRAKNWGFA